MPPVPTALIPHVMRLADSLAATPRGGKGALIAAAAGELAVAPQTLQRYLNAMTNKPARKRRSDAGESALTRDEAARISALLVETLRKNGKRLASVGRALDILRANGEIRAERVDADGVIRPLSDSAILRALRAYGLHPDDVLRPAAAITLASRHPNHVWQIDASLCVLYYLPRQAGLQVMDRAVFYKNKPANNARIEHDRVWRYAITDHASGHIYAEYVLGAESGENLAGVFINAIQKRDGEPAHGVPLVAMLDPGSANTGQLFKSLCAALQVKVQINEVGNPRAKGQVEKAHDMIERDFEAGLKFVRIDSLETLNTAAARWRKAFNGTNVMARHGMTRYEAWLRITAAQLRVAPEAAICRELATTGPEERTVKDTLQISYGGRLYDVSGVPDVQNRDKVLVCRNPWRPECAQVIARDADGREVYHVIEPVSKDEWGFAEGSPVITEEYKRHADTPAQKAAKAIELLVMEADTLEEAAAKRKGKALPFGGRLDPWKHMEAAAAALPAYIPKRGTPLETPLPGIAAAPDSLAVPARMVVEAERLNHVRMAGWLAPRVAGWDAEHYARMARLYPDGVVEAELPEVLARLDVGLPGVRLAAG